MVQEWSAISGVGRCMRQRQVHWGIGRSVLPCCLACSGVAGAEFEHPLPLALPNPPAHAQTMFSEGVVQPGFPNLILRPGEEYRNQVGFWDSKREGLPAAAASARLPLRQLVAMCLASPNLAFHVSSPVHLGNLAGRLALLPGGPLLHGWTGACKQRGCEARAALAVVTSWWQRHTGCRFTTFHSSNPPSRPTSNSPVIRHCCSPQKPYLSCHSCLP